MRYRLRTLLIVMALGPPLIAGFYFYPTVVVGCISAAQCTFRGDRALAHRLPRRTLLRCGAMLWRVVHLREIPMSQYRRWYQPGGTSFFTLVTYHRVRLFADARARALLGHCLR